MRAKKKATKQRNRKRREGTKGSKDAALIQSNKHQKKSLFREVNGCNSWLNSTRFSSVLWAKGQKRKGGASDTACVCSLNVTRRRTRKIHPVHCSWWKVCCPHAKIPSLPLSSHSAGSTPRWHTAVAEHHTQDTPASARADLCSLALQEA